MINTMDRLDLDVHGTFHMVSLGDRTELGALQGAGWGSPSLSLCLPSSCRPVKALTELGLCFPEPGLRLFLKLSGEALHSWCPVPRATLALEGPAHAHRLPRLPLPSRPPLPSSLPSFPFPPFPVPPSLQLSVPPSVPFPFLQVNCFSALLGCKPA